MKHLLLLPLVLIPMVSSGQFEVVKGKRDTIYYDPSNPPQVFKGGVEYVELQSYLFRSGSFDFVNNLWLDESSNGYDAELIDGNCIDINADVMITPTVALTDKTVVSVNDNTDFTGVTVIGENIVIDFSELTDTLLWNITLSDGQEFRLTTGVGKYVFSANNNAALGGTENTEWSWSKTNEAHLNLQYGYSKYPHSAAAYKRGFDYREPYLYDYAPFSVEWEGYAVTGGALFSLSSLVNASGTWDTYQYVCYINIANKTISFINRNRTHFRAENVSLTSNIKIRLEYNGSGTANLLNWSLYVNDTLRTLTTVTSSIDRAVGGCWAGNGHGDPPLFVRNYKYDINGREYWGIKDGIVFDYMLADKPTAYAYIPVFSTTDAFGFTPTNPSAVDAHNKAETKIKFPDIAPLRACDVDSFLFADTAKEINMSQMYSNIGDKIQCNNSDYRYIRDITLLDEPENLWEDLNGYNPITPIMYIRSDMDGENDADVLKLNDLLDSTNAQVSAHTSQMWNATSEVLGKHILNDKLSLAIHAFAPAFWKYGTWSEGRSAYETSTETEKTNGTVGINMGIVGDSISPYPSSRRNIEQIHALWDIPYPNDIAPDSADNNSEWWEWVISAFQTKFEESGGVISGISELGAYPAGYNIIEADVYNYLIADSAYQYEEYCNPKSIDITDSLDYGKSILTNTDSICYYQGDTVQVIDVTKVAIGNLKLPDYFLLASHKELSFKIKSLSGTLKPVTSITFIGTTTFSTNVSFGGVNYVNPVDTGWYTIKYFYRNKIYQLRVYDNNDSCVLNTRTAPGTNYNNNKISIYANGSNVAIKDLKMKAHFLRNISTNHTGWGNQDVGSYYYADVVDSVKRLILNNVYANRLGGIFSHYIKDPTTKEADGTLNGLLDRSYRGIKEISIWFSDSVGDIVNNHHMYDRSYLQGRKNLFMNTNLSDSIAGLSGALWGTNLTKDLSQNLFVGDNVGKLGIGSTMYIYRDFSDFGMKWLMFWAKGKFRLNISSYYNSEFNPTTWTYYCFPIYVGQNESSPLSGSLSITATADTYFQKIEIDD